MCKSGQGNKSAASCSLAKLSTSCVAIGQYELSKIVQFKNRSHASVVNSDKKITFTHLKGFPKVVLPPQKPGASTSVQPA